MSYLIYIVKVMLAKVEEQARINEYANGPRKSEVNYALVCQYPSLSKMAKGLSIQ